MRRLSYILLIVITIFSVVISACSPKQVMPAQATKPVMNFKLAAILPGVITDADYNTLAYISINNVKTDLGIETVFKENVLPADVDSVIREYLKQDYNVIWTHGGQFVNQTVVLAKEFPNVTFIAEGDVPVENPPANLWFITRNFHVGFYAVGVTAGLASKTGKIGYISGATLPFSYAEVHAIQQAIKEQNLNVELITVWTGDFNDPTKARKAAEGLIAEDVDVIIGSLNLGMVGIFDAAKASGKPVLVTAKYSDKTTYAPKNYITALLYDFTDPLKEILMKVQNGEKGGVYPLGFATGVSLQSPLQNVSADLQTRVDAIMKEIKEGKINVVNDVTPVQ